MSFLDKNGLTYFYSKIKEKFIRSVNSQTPDDNGNVLISNVATADNLTSPDAKPHNSEGFIYRTSGGIEDLANGEAELIYIDGACKHTGYIPESYVSSSTNGIQIEINKNDWPFKEQSGEYTFVYYPPTGSSAVSRWAPETGSWEFNSQPVDNISASYGINVSNLVMPQITISSDNSLVVTIVPNTWVNKGLESKEHYLIYQEDGWYLNDNKIILNDYGINITGTPVIENTIIINYIQGTLYGSLTITYQKEVLGTIKVAKPTQFVATGFNQFDKDSMVIENATIQDNQIVENSGTYVCYCREPGNIEGGFVAYSRGSHIENIGWCENIPVIGTNITTDNITYNNLLSFIEFENDGYIVVTVDATDDLCIHPKHSGGYNEVYEDYVAPSIVIFPTQDTESNPLPLVDYGMPAVKGIADRLNLDLGTYTQRIGRITNNPEGWNFIINSGLSDQEEHDDEYIYYILPTPVVYQVTANPTYIVNDMGTEEFVGTTVPIPCQLLYGQNLRDKLRNDVLTITPQDLTNNQKNSVWNNLGINDIVDTIAKYNTISTPRTYIPNGDDLDNYWHWGTWRINSGGTSSDVSAAGKIANVPYTGAGGKLISVGINSFEDDGTYMAQFYITSDGRLYFRYKRGGNPVNWSLLYYQPDTNYTSFSANTNVFNSTSWSCYVYRKNNLVTFNYNISGTIKTNDSNNQTLVTLPAQYRPPHQIVHEAVAQNGKTYVLTIQTDGSVQINPTSQHATKSWYREVLTYGV